jgi:glutaredoxin
MAPEVSMSQIGLFEMSAKKGENIVIWDIETQSTIKDVGGLNKLRISGAVAYSSADEKYYRYTESNIQDLVKLLQTATLSIGFNTFAVSEKLLRPEKFIKRKVIANRLDVFVMSDCPFGKAAMKYLSDNKMNQKYDVHVHYIVNKNPKGKTGRYVPYRSLHGESEFFENLRQICVQQEAPDFYWSYPFAEKPAVRNDYFNKIKNKSIEDCHQTANYRSKVYQLVENDIKFTQELGISSSPTFLFNNQNVYVGLGTVQKALNWPMVKGQPAGSAGACNTLPVIK